MWMQYNVSLFFSVNFLCLVINLIIDMLRRLGDAMRLQPYYLIIRVLHRIRNFVIRISVSYNTCLSPSLSLLDKGGAGASHTLLSFHGLLFSFTNIWEILGDSKCCFVDIISICLEMNYNY